MPAPMNMNPEVIFLASSHFVTYAGPVANTNLVAEGLSNCRRIRSEGAGTLVVKRASDKAPVVLNFKAGETQDVQATELVAAGSTAVDVTVYW